MHASNTGSSSSGTCINAVRKHGWRVGWCIWWFEVVLSEKVYNAIVMWKRIDGVQGWCHWYVVLHVHLKTAPTQLGFLREVGQYRSLKGLIGGALGAGDIRLYVGPWGPSIWAGSGHVWGLFEDGKENLVHVGGVATGLCMCSGSAVVLIMLSCALFRQRKLTLSTRETGLVRVSWPAES